MVDCGEGAQRSFQFHRLKPSRLGHIFLTHLHGDHVFGLPGLVGTMGLQNEGGTLHIHTFEDGKEILTKILDYFSRDLSFDVVYDIIDPTAEQVVYDDHSLTITSLPLNHKIDCVGFLFEEKPGLRHIRREMVDFHQVPVHLLNSIRAGADFTRPDGKVIPNSVLTTDPTPPRRYAHISDTAYIPGLAERIGPVDLLLHETTYLQQYENDARKRGHSTARQAATVARDAGAKRLLTTHYSSRYYKDETGFLQEAREVYDGEVLLNDESLILDI